MSDRTADKPTSSVPATDAVAQAYRLDEQVGFLLRRAHQRASAIFAETIGEQGLTPTQFAALAKIFEHQSVSQNRLGRLTAMDPATMQGVIARLSGRGLIDRAPDPTDRRRTRLTLTSKGLRAFVGSVANGLEISRKTLAPLKAEERREFLRLLEKLT